MNSSRKSKFLSYVMVMAPLIGAVAGDVLFRTGNFLLMGSATKTVAVLIGTVWVTLMAFATKISDITESPALTAEEHRSLEERCRNAVRKVWKLAAINAIAVIVVLVPSAVVDAKSSPAEWMLLFSGAASGFAIYSLAAHAWWQEELRSFRSMLRLRERELNEKKEKIKSLGNDKDNPAPPAIVESLNRSFDWPANQQKPH